MRLFAVLCLAAGSAFAAEFLTGQAARAVIGQPSFTAQTMPATPSGSILGAASGVAYANGMLFVADDNRLAAFPGDNRVLIYRNIRQQLPLSTGEPAQGSRCPLCVGPADMVLGQPDFTKIDAGLGASGLRQPTAVASDGHHLVISDTNNNRVLIWNTIPSSSNAPADIVLGQPDFSTNIPNNGTAGPTFASSKTLRGPAGVWIQDGKLFVADNQNNRVLIWNTFPTANFQAADVVLGQPNMNSVIQPDLTKADPTVSSTTLLNPVGVSSDGVHLFVADLGSNRVLIWNSIPTQDQVPADVVIGQPGMTTSVPNYSSKIVSQNTTTGEIVSEGVLCQSNGTDTNDNPTFPALCGATLSFPRSVISDGARLFIADGGNDRVLVFNHIPTQNGARADAVLGQPDEFSVATSDNTTSYPPNPNVDRRAAADAVRTPTSLAWDGDSLYVAEPFSRRLLVFSPGDSAALPTIRNAASLVLYAHATITLSGTQKEGDQVHVTIAGADYVYQVKKNEQLSDVAQGLTDVINNSNNGAGDPYMLATTMPALAQVQLTARKGGSAGNNIPVATTTSTNAGIVSAASRVTGGSESADLAPGTLVSVFGANLADQEAVASPAPGENWPDHLGGVELFVDGIRSPLLYAGPNQINGQLPWPISDGTSSSAYLRITRNDGSVAVTQPIAIKVVPANPGIFSLTGPDPRPAMAYHFSNYALATISIDGTAKVGATATITINKNRDYAYTVKDGDKLITIRDALISKINAGDPDVTAYVGAQWTRIRLRAKQSGTAGNGIPVAVKSSDGSLVVSASHTELCCASVAGQAVDTQHPAVPGETIVVYATGIGTMHDDAGNPINITAGVPYAGPEINVPDVFVSSLAGGRTASVIAAALVPGTIDLYQVQLELNTDLPTNPTTQCYISQNNYISNLVTFPVVAPPK